MAAEKAPKFDVSTLAKDLGILEASVRVQLRNNNVKKNKDTGTYAWNSRSEYEGVLGKLKKDAPVKTAKSKKTAKKASAKKAA